MSRETIEAATIPAVFSVVLFAESICNVFLELLTWVF